MKNVPGKVYSIILFLSLKVYACLSIGTKINYGPSVWWNAKWSYCLESWYGTVPKMMKKIGL